MTSHTKHYLDSIDPFASRFIRAKVRQLIRQVGFPADDREDLLHDFAVDLLHRRASFDANAGAWEAFVVVVCENRFASILAHHRAAMRSWDRKPSSLDEGTQNGEGEQATVGDTLADDCHEWRTGRRQRTWIDTADLAMDLAEFLDSLPPAMRDLCERRKVSTISEAAKAMGITRVAAYERLRRIREAGEKKDLRDYL